MKRTASGRKKESQSKTKPITSFLSKQKEKSSEGLSFAELFQTERQNEAESIIQFSFKKKRVRVLSEASEVKHDAKGVIYWMSRDARVQDNWAFLFAQKLALKNTLPLEVCYCLGPTFLGATMRHHNFLLKGLQEVEEECKALKINFNLLLGNAAEKIPEFVKTNEIGAVVCDFSPLRVPLKWVNDVKEKLPEDVPLCQVDAHNIVPVWEASNKQEYAARTIRNKINGQLSAYLSGFPPLIKHPHTSDRQTKPIDWDCVYSSLLCDSTVADVEWATPGYKSACKELQDFCEKRLRKFAEKRNDPAENALSNLSPWFHFGQISVQRCILTVNKYKKHHSESVASFCEEAIVRRELADNFCFYNENYDNLNGIASWALKTLNDHRKDKRPYIYTKEELETSKTHDDLWNSAQIQLVKEGKMHGFLRMYWAKKILEWTESPEQALEYSIYLNDKYSLDGQDPNGYVGCMWSIGGVHDQGWGERQVFGKIRFMNYQGCKRKFDVDAFVARYGGKVYTKK